MNLTSIGYYGNRDESLLHLGAKIEPKKLLGSSYPFLYPKLEQALKNLLK